MDENRYFIAVVNQSAAAGIVHNNIPGTDMAAIVKEIGDDGKARPVREEDLQKMYMTDEEVLEMAQHTTNTMHFSAVPIAAALGLDMDHAGMDAEQSADVSAPYDETPLYVLSNEQGQDGAAAITRPDIMRTITEKFGPVYVLPSSIHEVLILPQDAIPGSKEENIRNLRQTIYEINRSEVLPEERLSDRLYQHDGHALSEAKIHQETQEQDRTLNAERSMV
jgi:hypothetical protein